MDFVDEQNVAVFQIREQRREIAGLGDHRPGGGAEIDAELARDDLRQRGLAEARGTHEQYVIERFLALLRRLDEDGEIGAGFLLADEFGKPLRAQVRLGDVIVADFRGDQPPAHRASSLRLARIRASAVALSPEERIAAETAALA